MAIENEIIENIGGEFGLTVSYKPNKIEEDDRIFSVDFNVYEIIGVDDNGPLYTKDGAISSMDTVIDIKEAENYFRGFVKWDGCSHYYMGDETNSGYLHLCGIKNIEKLSNAIKIVFARCMFFMGEEP